MAGYGYPYPPAYPPIHPEGEYPDHGDGFGDYYGLGPEDPSKRSPYPPEGWLPNVPHGNYECGDPWGPIMFPYTYWKWMSMPLTSPPPEYNLHQRPSCSKYNTRKSRQRSRSHESDTKSHSRTRSKSRSRSRSRSRSKSRSLSKSRSHSKSRSASRSHSRSSRHIELTYKQPNLLDAFRVIYLTPSKHKKSTTKYLATKKKQDRIQELLKSDGLGSKRWLFYPRTHSQSEPLTGEVPGTRDNVDQRIKVDGDFFRKYKKSKKVDSDAPITKLRRWELVLYKKLGFVQAV